MNIGRFQTHLIPLQYYRASLNIGLFVFVFSIFSSVNLYASSGTEGASFLDIPVGAGPAALGSAYTALAADAYAPTWNPGGLGFLQGTELAGQHLSYLESTRYEYFSMVRPFAESSASTTHSDLGYS